MAVSPCLFSMPPELLVSIMSAVESPLDLWAFIRASPAGYRVFRNYRTSVLSHVLHNAIGEEVMPDALGALYSSHLNVPENTVTLTATECRDRVTTFLANFHEKTLEFPKDAESLDGLFRICNTVMSLVGDYSSRAIVLLDKTLHGQRIVPALPSSELRQGIPLSRHEQSRFLRAFFRYEMYCNCFRPAEKTSCGSHDATIFTKYERSRLFLTPLPKWEVEEIYCVYQYLISKVAKIVSEIENQFCRDIINAHIDESSDAVNIVYRDEWIDLERRASKEELDKVRPFLLCEVGYLDSEGLDAFDACLHEGRNTFFDHMCRYGLSFLKDWFVSDFAAQHSVFARYGHRTTSQLNVQNTFASFNKTYFTQSQTPTTTMEESSRTYNMGWKMTEGDLRTALRPRSTYSGYDAAWDTLIDCGYVFWDAWHFQKGSLRTQLYKFRDCGNQLSPEHRVRHVRLLWKDKCEILDKYRERPIRRVPCPVSRPSRGNVPQKEQV
ncbi:hypothetical protein F5Y14DRAFT_401497 [Nemania sp. NC0429]|nr:hypothetical protein F5Y14DRAFT_401497 [Nemania sp. NC0429]